MKRSREDTEEHDRDYSELDRLVLEELQAMEARASRGGRSRVGKRRSRSKGNNVIFRDDWRVSDRPEAETSGADDEPPDEEPGFAEAAEMRPSPPTDAAEDIGPEAGEQLFSGDEQAFISRAAEWLAPKDNKDLILSRIWALLTESQPDSFFAADNQSRDEDILPGEEETPEPPEQDGRE